MLGHYLHWSKLAFLAAAIGLTLLLAQDARPAQTATTRVFITKSTSTVPETIVLFPNGPLQQFHVRVESVKDPTGVSSFEVDMEVPEHLVDIYQMNYNLPWIQSTGRVATCTPPQFTTKSATVTTANVSCNTYGSAPPYGATTTGGQKPPIATVYLQPGATWGNSIVKLTPITALVNTPIDPDDLAEIPIIRQNAALIVAKCADFNADNVVSIIDIARIVQRFGTTEAFYDLNLDGNITIGDITITIAQFGYTCPPP